uniref:Uncharacterized protein n=1 Tax=Lepeophtheirus salmonis TaxID=72036 RepID=A0A0K2TDF3_LEPSM
MGCHTHSRWISLFLRGSSKLIAGSFPMMFTQQHHIMFYELVIVLINSYI